MTQAFSELHVASIIIEYCHKNQLFDPKKKKIVICDAKLRNLLRKRSVNKNNIQNLLESHFVDNFEETDGIISSSEERDNGNEAFKFPKQGNLNSTTKPCQNVLSEEQPSGFAAIINSNMKLVYLKRSLIEELSKQPETFDGKVLGSYVRTKSDPNDYLQKNSHLLLQVIGINRSSKQDDINQEILLRLSNVPKDVPISQVSDVDFYEEECHDLYQRMTNGVLKKPTVVISTFLLMGLIFIPVGLVTLRASYSVVEIVDRYDIDCVPEEYRSNKVAYVKDDSISKNCTRFLKTTDSNMAPSCWEVFQKTHKMKGDPSKWVSSKSQMVAEEYERRIFERNSQQTDGDDVSNDHQSDNIIFLDVVGGVDKKGRIYGLGPEAGKYKPSSCRSSDGISPSEYEHMRTVISKMSAENMELKEQLKTHEELIRASQEESRLLREQSQEESRLLREQSQEDSRLLREQLQKFMESFSQGHSHLPPYRPHPSSWDPPLSPS